MKKPLLHEFKINPDWAKLPLFDRSKWQRVRFGDVVRVMKEQVDPASGEVDRYVAGEHMETENVHIRKWGTVGDGYLGPAFIRRFRKGQVLYGSRRTYLKKVAVAEWDGVTSNTTLVLEAVEGKLLQALLPWLMLSERFTRHSVAESKGSTNPYINWPDIAKFEFDLPPLVQQDRIAEMLSALNESQQALLSAKEHVAIARAAKMQREFFGVADDVAVVDQTIDGRPLPKGYTIRAAGELVCSPITKGATPSSRLNTPMATVPFIKVYNLKFSGDLDFSGDPTYVELDAHVGELKRSRVFPGDILMETLNKSPVALS